MLFFITCAFIQSAQADQAKKTNKSYTFLMQASMDADGLEQPRTSRDIEQVIHTQELYGPREGQLDVELSEDGAKKMFTLTKNMQHGRDRLAIVLDGKVLSAPTVQSALSKNFQISGMGTAKEAKALAAALLNPLKNPLTLEKEESFTP